MKRSLSGGPSSSICLYTSRSPTGEPERIYIIVLDELMKADGELNMFRLDSETVKHKSLHQPLDMLIAIIAVAHFLPKTELDNDEMNLKKYFHQIAPIYLLESGNFDYVKKDIYSHEVA